MIDNELILFLVFLGVFIALVFHIVAACKMSDIAYEKGSADNYLAWCLFFPLIGYAMVIALPDKRTREATEVLAYNVAVRYTSEQSPQAQQSKTVEDELPEL